MDISANYEWNDDEEQMNVTTVECRGEYDSETKKRHSLTFRMIGSTAQFEEGNTNRYFLEDAAEKVRELPFVQAVDTEMQLIG